MLRFAREVNPDIGLISYNPSVVPWMKYVNVAGAYLLLRAIVVH
jgi:hypothetical protein